MNINFYQNKKNIIDIKDLIKETFNKDFKSVHLNQADNSVLLKDKQNTELDKLIRKHTEKKSE